MLVSSLYNWWNTPQQVYFSKLENSHIFNHLLHNVSSGKKLQGTIPPELFSLKSLKCVSLCEKCDDELHWYPAKWTRSVVLIYLVAWAYLNSGNFLYHYDSRIFLMYINFWIAYNSLMGTIPSNIGNLIKLKELTIGE